MTVTGLLRWQDDGIIDTKSIYQCWEPSSYSVIPATFSPLRDHVVAPPGTLHPVARTEAGDKCSSHRKALSCERAGPGPGGWRFISKHLPLLRDADTNKRQAVAPAALVPVLRALGSMCGGDKKLTVRRRQEAHLLPFRPVHMALVRHPQNVFCHLQRFPGKSSKMWEVTEIL